MKRLTAWLPDDPRHRWLAIGLLTLLLLERLGLIFGQPDLLHDLDAAELKHTDLALLGLPGGATLKDRLFTFLSGPENIHHGGLKVLELLSLNKLLNALYYVIDERHEFVQRTHEGIHDRDGDRAERHQNLVL